MRILICISSRLRLGSALCLKSLLAILRTHYEATIDLIGHFPPHNQETLEEVVNAVDYHKFVIEDDPPISSSDQKYAMFMEPYVNRIDNNLLQWNSMLRCAQIAKQIIAERGPYNCALWSRPDLYFSPRSILPSKFPANTIFLPAFDSWHGFFDRFSIGDPDAIVRRMELLPFFQDEWFKEMLRRSSTRLGNCSLWNPEYVLACFLKHKLKFNVIGIPTVPLRFREVNNKYFLVVQGKAGPETEFSFDGHYGNTKDWAVFNEDYSNILDLTKNDNSLPDPRIVSRTHEHARSLERILVPLDSVTRYFEE